MTFHNKFEITRLADQLERAFRGGAWHGPATREALSGIDADKSGRRLEGSPHTIVEHIRHMAFWLNAAHLRIAEGYDVSNEEDWPEMGTLSDEGWAQTVKNLEQAQGNLLTTLLDLADNRLDDPVAGSGPTVRGLLLGNLQHNAYHTGQIVQIARELAK